MLCTLIVSIILSINIQVGLNMYPYDDIGDASSSLRGSTSIFIPNKTNQNILYKSTLILSMARMKHNIESFLRLGYMDVMRMLNVKKLYWSTNFVILLSKCHWNIEVIQLFVRNTIWRILCIILYIIAYDNVCHCICNHLVILHVSAHIQSHISIVYLMV